MAAVTYASLSPSLYHSSSTTAFGDKSLKPLRVTSDLVSHLVAAVFYEIISTCFWVCCCPGSAYKYESFSRYYFNKGTDQVTTYLGYSDKMINFSYNVSRCVKEILPKGVSEKKALRSLYGKKIIDSWMEIGGSGLSVKKESLFRSDMIQGGCCMGMSLEFNAKYLKGVQKGLTPLEAVKYASYRYEKGSTKKAELIQIFGRALNIKHEKQIPARMRILARQVNIKLKTELVYPHSNMDEKSGVFEKFVKRLPDGVYTVLLTPNNIVGHAVSMAKAGGAYFLFNPSTATLSLNAEEIAQEMRKIGKETAEEPECRISFHPFKLI